MSHPWSIASSAYGKQGTPDALKKDATREKEAERWRDESDPEEGFKLREKIIGGRRAFGLVVGKDDDCDEIDMRIDEDEGLCLINKLKMEDHDRQESLDKLDMHIKRSEEKVLGSHSMFSFCDATWTIWMKRSSKGWRLTLIFVFVLLIRRRRRLK
jgi:hypothetical protein